MFVTQKLTRRNHIKNEHTPICSLYLPAFGKIISVNDCSINGKQQHNYDVVEQTKQPKYGFRYHVEWRYEVHDCTDHANDYSQSEYVNDATVGEEIVAQMAKKCGQIVQIVKPLNDKQKG